jgi:hypothetical protein
LPPEEIRWFATSGIIVTSEPVRDRIMALTRSMSAALDRGLVLGSERQNDGQDLRSLGLNCALESTEPAAMESG